MASLEFSNRRRSSALGWTGLCVMAWSLIPWLASDRGSLDSHQYLMWSSLVSTGCLLLCTRVLGKWRVLTSYSGRDVVRLVALGSMGAFGYYALLYWAYAPCGENCRRTEPVLIIAQYTWPALAVLWSSVLLRERLTGRVVASLLLGILAVAVGAMSAAATSHLSTALFVVFFAAVIFGLYSALLKQTNYEPFSSLAVGFGAAAVLSLGEVLLFSDGIQLPRGSAIRAVLLNGLFANGLSYVCWYRALRAAPVSVVAPWVALSPVLATLIATTGADGSDVSPAQWAGVALVLLSVLVANRPPRLAREPQGGEPLASPLEEGTILGWHREAALQHPVVPRPQRRLGFVVSLQTREADPEESGALKSAP